MRFTIKTATVKVVPNESFDKLLHPAPFPLATLLVANFAMAAMEAIMTRLLERLRSAKLLLQDGLGSRRYATEPLGDNSRIEIEKCKDLLDRIENEDGSWAT